VISATSGITPLVKTFQQGYRCSLIPRDRGCVVGAVRDGVLLVSHFIHSIFLLLLVAIKLRFVSFACITDSSV